jgi:hypothetical protein
MSTRAGLCSTRLERRSMPGPLKGGK